VRRAVLAVILGSVLLCLAACGTTSRASTGTKARPGSAAQTAATPLPAGRNPSEIAKMVCAVKAQHEIGEILGVKAHVSSPTWADHLYTCHYLYGNSSFSLSVKELSSWSQTLAYFHALGLRLGDTGTLGNLGQGAFATRDGSVVVRKDWKVLLVDISALPREFGKPPTGSSDVAFTVADVILGCWQGD
jgi:hypothetical protein